MAIADGQPVNAANSNPAWVGQEYIKDGIATTVTAAGTLTLTAASVSFQEFTGTTTHTCVLPSATTLVSGRLFRIMNRSTGAIAVKYADGTTTAYVVPGNSSVFLQVVSIGTSNGTWDIDTAVSIDASGNITGVGTLTATGLIKSTAGSPGFQIQPASVTSAAYFQCTNTGGSFYCGLDNSTGGVFGVGNYAGVVFSPTVLVFFSGGTKALSFDTSQNATFAGAITTTSASITPGTGVTTPVAPNVATSYLDPLGFVRLAGFLKSSSGTVTSGTILGTIAAGARPNRTVVIPVFMVGSGIDGGSYLTITTAGNITCGDNVTTTVYPDLNSVSFVKTN